jgi:hypothetical protein
MAMGSPDSVPAADTLPAVTNAPRSNVNPRLEPVPCSGRMLRAARQTHLGHVARDSTMKNFATLQMIEAGHSRVANNATCRDSRSSRDSDQ